ncbi:hypothetical protein BBI01_03030 [Chryseobacterium artocarpi]|uniref:LysM domain-containing protein n=1 Tax=Chryseobacterium artocarpi TaxID=1414727 RepID=A0A1B9A0U2_9FLAO|nr:hypothetical protein [Chryseobacterium artocarpi]OCA77443.1 hypothetical protein BBI01_03030 [Chryseobacterium artocarpi]
MERNIPNREGPVHEINSKKQNIYFVKSGETLESISESLNLENPTYLRDYHNERCQPFDIIPEEGTLRLLQKICIPDPDEIIQINELIKQRGESLYHQFSEGKIPFDVEKLQGNYQVKQSESDDEIKKSDYAYTLNFSFIKEKEERYYIDFSMSDFKKDGQEPEEKINMLASAFVRVIYPITFVVDHAGSLTDVQTHKDIAQMIDEIEELKKYHSGSYAALHINQMKHKIADPQVMFESLKNMLAIQFLLGQFYQAVYTRNISVPYNSEFSWLAPASPVRMEMVNQVLSQYESGFLEILQVGKSRDYRTVQELYYTDQEYDPLAELHSKSLTAEHSAIYSLNSADFSIRKIKADFKIQIADYEKTISLELERITG